MSQSPSYQRDTASASPESPEEGDFSSRQLCDKTKSLEESETCNWSKPGHFRTLPTKQELFNNASPGLLKSLPPQEAEDKKMPERTDDLPSVGLPRLLAYKPEPEQALHVEKVPEVESKQDVHLAQCDYCQQLCQPFIHSKVLESEADYERLFCCEQAKQMRELILEEQEKLAWKESDRKIDVSVRAPAVSEETGEAAEDEAKRKLSQLKLRRELKRDNLKKSLNPPDIKPGLSGMSERIPSIVHEPHIPERDIKRLTDMCRLQDDTNAEPKLKHVMRKFYESGKCFLILCQDGTGNVFYPSGRAAIIISSAEAADFTYVILEDKDKEPSIKGVFTNKGRCTCYHPNGMIWLNLTPAGGLCLSETGALRRSWSWLYFDSHAHNLPFKPLTFALGPHVSVRIHSQERIYVTFTHKKNSMQFNVGSRLEVIYSDSHDKLGHEVLQRYVQMKSSEIYSLLGQIQTCISYPHSFITRNRGLADKLKKRGCLQKDDVN
ncbi:uncharacterized protein V6R79_000842 [Siganus canaliculatus]